MSDDARLTALFNELRGSLTYVRQAAAEGLIEIGEPAVPGLIESLSKEYHPKVHYVAVDALLRIGTPEAIDAIERWRMRQ